MKKFYNLIMFLTISLYNYGQTIEPMAFDLVSPTDVNRDASGNLWVNTLGSGSDDGKIYRISPDGDKELIIDSLPSFFDPQTEELSGVLSARYEEDGFIYVVQGGGNHAFSGSLLIFSMTDYETLGRPLMVSEFQRRIAVSDFVLSNGFEESNPYSFLFIPDGYIIVDAAANALIKYDIDTEAFSIFAVFPPFENPLPFGPPFVDVVPTKIVDNGGSYLVSSLTGFPFADGASKIYEIDLEGNISTYADGLTLVTDMERAADGGLYVQQFARFGEGPMGPTFLFGSAQLMHIDALGVKETVLSGYGPSPGFAVGENGTIFMTHLFLGQLLKAEMTTDVLDVQEEIISKVYPNPATDHLTILTEKGFTVDDLQIYDIYGRLLKDFDFIIGRDQIEIVLNNNVVGGQYFIRLNAQNNNVVHSFIKH